MAKREEASLTRGGELQVVWQIWEILGKHGIHMRVRWCSREDPCLKQADSYTRESDEGGVWAQGEVR